MKSQSLHSSFGVFGGVNYNFISSSFSELPGFTKPPATFSANNELGIHFGAYFQLPITEKIYLLPRFSYFQSPSSLEAFEPTTFIVNGVPIPGVFRHTISAQLSTISFEGLLGYRMYSNLDIFGGASIGYYIGRNFNQQEEIFSPDSVRFLPGITTRNPRSGEIPSMNLQSFVIVGMRNTFIKNLFEIVPEITYHFPLQAITSTVDWNLSSIRLGVSIGKILPKDTIVERTLIKVYDTLYVRDTIVKTINELPSSQTVVFDRIRNQTITLSSYNESTNTERYTVTVNLQYIRYFYKLQKKSEKVLVEQPDFIISRDSQGNEVVQTAVTYLRKIQKVSIPVLPYIFFDKASSIIPARYKRSSSVNSSVNSLESYYTILSVVAQRLRSNQNAQLTVTGYVSQENPEEQSPTLSLARAESIKSALVQLGVTASQIEVKNGLLPPKYSRNDGEFGNAENRRVELSSNDNSVLSPIVIETELDNTTETPLYLLPNTKNALIESQYFEITYEGSTKKYPLESLENINNRKVQSVLKFPFNLISPSNFKTNNIIQKNLDVTLVSLYKDSIQKTTKSITVMIKDTSLVENEELSVLLFDYDSAEITEQMRQQLQSYTSRDNSNKTLKFIGTTDVIGSPQYNKELSLKRANSISSLFSGKKEIIGFGPDNTTFNNNLPEGRFYSRTVKIEIR